MVKSQVAKRKDSPVRGIYFAHYQNLVDNLGREDPSLRYLSEQASKTGLDYQTRIENILGNLQFSMFDSQIKREYLKGVLSSVREGLVKNNKRRSKYLKIPAGPDKSINKDELSELEDKKEHEKQENHKKLVGLERTLYDYISEVEGMVSDTGNLARSFYGYMDETKDRRNPVSSAKSVKTSLSNGKKYKSNVTIQDPRKPNMDSPIKTEPMMDIIDISDGYSGNSRETSMQIAPLVPAHLGTKNVTPQIIRKRPLLARLANATLKSLITGAVVTGFLLGGCKRSSDSYSESSPEPIVPGIVMQEKYDSLSKEYEESKLSSAQFSSNLVTQINTLTANQDLASSNYNAQIIALSASNAELKAELARVNSNLSTNLESKVQTSSAPQVIIQDIVSTSLPSTNNPTTLSGTNAVSESRVLYGQDKREYGKMGSLGKKQRVQLINEGERDSDSSVKFDQTGNLGGRRMFGSNHKFMKKKSFNSHEGLLGKIGEDFNRFIEHGINEGSTNSVENLNIAGNAIENAGSAALATITASHIGDDYDFTKADDLKPKKFLSQLGNSFVDELKRISFFADREAYEGVKDPITGTLTYGWRLINGATITKDQNSGIGANIVNSALLGIGNNIYYPALGTVGSTFKAGEQVVMSALNSPRLISDNETFNSIWNIPSIGAPHLAYELSVGRGGQNLENTQLSIDDRGVIMTDFEALIAGWLKIRTIKNLNDNNGDNVDGGDNGGEGTGVVNGGDGGLEGVH